MDECVAFSEMRRDGLVGGLVGIMCGRCSRIEQTHLKGIHTFLRNVIFTSKFNTVIGT